MQEAYSTVPANRAELFSSDILGYYLKKFVKIKTKKKKKKEKKSTNKLNDCISKVTKFKIKNILLITQITNII